MQILSIDEAKAQLPRLIERGAQGEPFIIAQTGKLVKVILVDVSPVNRPPQRLGFLKGHVSVPDDFDRMGGEDIERLFGGG